jgi:hypothetical protein
LALFGALHFINKQSYNFDLYDSLIERQRQRLGRMSMHRETIEGLADLPSWTALRKRDRWTFTRRQGAVRIWRIVLIGLIAINVAVGIYALVFEWVGNDPGWLSSPSQEAPRHGYFGGHD